MPLPPPKKMEIKTIKRIRQPEQEKKEEKPQDKTKKTEELKCIKCGISQWRLIGDINDLQLEKEYITTLNKKEEKDQGGDYHFDKGHPIKKIYLICTKCGFALQGYMRLKIIEKLFVSKDGEVSRNKSGEIKAN